MMRERLFELQDLKYKEFQAKLIPNIDASRIIGVRTPALRSLAKEAAKSEDGAAFLETLPHTFFEENQLHAFVISLEKDFDTCLAEVNQFLPYVDNWATCDQMSPKIFKTNKEKLLPAILQWMGAEAEYTVRFGVGMLMQHFLEEDFQEEFLQRVANIKRGEYYINMMCAWYFATALAKQWDAAIVYLEQHRLSPWVHRKSIQKAVESYRISDEQKSYLKSLR